MATKPDSANDPGKGTGNDKPSNDSETNDGYHTMDELYEHRHALWAVVALYLGDRAWKSRKHELGGDKMYPGWFIAGADLPFSGQVSYHLPEKLWGICPGRELPNAPAYDGHSAPLVVERLWRYVTEVQTAKLREEAARAQLGELTTLRWSDLGISDRTQLMRYTFLYEKSPADARAEYHGPETREDIRRLPHALACEVAERLIRDGAKSGDTMPTARALGEALGVEEWMDLLKENARAAIRVVKDGLQKSITWGDLSDKDKSSLVKYREEYDKNGPYAARRNAPVIWSREDLAALSVDASCDFAEDIIGVLVGKSAPDVGIGDLENSLGSVEYQRLRKLASTVTGQLTADTTVEGTGTGNV